MGVAAGGFWAYLVIRSVTVCRRAVAVIRFDISLPRSQLPALRAASLGALTAQYPQLHICASTTAVTVAIISHLFWPASAGPTTMLGAVDAGSS